MEKARLDCISQLIEITEREHNHELLLSMRNLHESTTFHHCGSPKADIGELFISGICSRTFCSAGLPTVVRARSQACLVTFGRARFTTCPRAVKKKKKKKKTKQDKVVCVGFEGFVDWMDPTISKSAEEREVEISSLAVGFVARMCKLAAKDQEKTTPSFVGPDRKHFKQSCPVEEVQISPTSISVDSLERAPGVLPDLKSDPQGSSWESCTLLADEAPTEEPPLDSEVAN